MSTTTPHTQTAYKDTPIGKIPADWEVKRLKNVGKVITGSTPSTNNSEYYGDEYLFISPIDLGEEKYVVNSVKKLSKFGLSVCRKIPENSILFTCIGSTIGKIGISKFELATNQQINSIVPFENYDFEYLYYQLEFEAIKIKLLAGEQAVPIINKSEFENIILRIAPLPEQKRIAEVLSTWDKAIQLTEQLIRQKEQRKKWLMQNLLTGKMRLKGFSGEWKEYRISDCLSRMSNGITYNTEKREGIPVTRIETIADGMINFNKIGFADAVDNIEDYRLQKGDILYSHINSLGHIGKVAIYNDEKPLYHGMNLLLLRCNEQVNSIFFYQWLTSENGKKKAISLAKPAVNQASISTSELRKVRITLPSIKEQTAIAEVLQTADKEIELLKAKAEKLKEQKKGLMQQLLTGKKRLL